MTATIESDLEKAPQVVGVEEVPPAYSESEAAEEDHQRPPPPQRAVPLLDEKARLPSYDNSTHPSNTPDASNHGDDADDHENVDSDKESTFLKQDASEAVTDRLVMTPRAISPLVFRYNPLLSSSFGIPEAIWKMFITRLRAATALAPSQKALLAAASAGLLVLTHGPWIPALVGYGVWRHQVVKNLHKGMIARANEGVDTGVTRKETVAEVLVDFNTQLMEKGVKVALLLPEVREKGVCKKRWVHGCCTTQGECNALAAGEKEGDTCCKCCGKGDQGKEGSRGKGCRGRRETFREKRERRSVRILVERLTGDDKTEVEKV